MDIGSILQESAKDIDYSIDEFEAADDEKPGERSGSAMDILKKSAKVVAKEDRREADESLSREASSMKEERNITLDAKSLVTEIKVDELTRSPKVITKSKVTHIDSDDDSEVDHRHSYQERESSRQLILACYKDDHRKVETLLDRGAQSHFIDKDGWTGLHWAASKGYEGILGLLIERSTIKKSKLVNIADTISGWTPLHVACVSGSLKCARLLLSHGANKDALNFMNETPLDCVTPTVRDAKLIVSLLSDDAEGLDNYAESSTSRSRREDEAKR